MKKSYLATHNIVFIRYSHRVMFVALIAYLLLVETHGFSGKGLLVSFVAGSVSGSLMPFAWKRDSTLLNTIAIIPFMFLPQSDDFFNHQDATWQTIPACIFFAGLVWYGFKRHWLGYLAPSIEHPPTK